MDPAGEPPPPPPPPPPLFDFGFDGLSEEQKEDIRRQRTLNKMRAASLRVRDKRRGHEAGGIPGDAAAGAAAAGFPVGGELDAAAALLPSSVEFVAALDYLDQRDKMDYLDPLPPPRDPRQQPAGLRLHRNGGAAAAAPLPPLPPPAALLPPAAWAPRAAARLGAGARGLRAMGGDAAKREREERGGLPGGLDESCDREEANGVRSKGGGAAHILNGLVLDIGGRGGGDGLILKRSRGRGRQHPKPVAAAASASSASSVGVFVSNQPITPESNYFEIKVMDTPRLPIPLAAGGGGHEKAGGLLDICIGLASSSFGNAAPIVHLGSGGGGRGEISIGYHLGTGKLHLPPTPSSKGMGGRGGGSSSKVIDLGSAAVCCKGDTVGCGVQFPLSSDHASSSSLPVRIFFTRNGRKIRRHAAAASDDAAGDVVSVLLHLPKSGGVGGAGSILHPAVTIGDGGVDHQEVSLLRLPSLPPPPVAATESLMAVDTAEEDWLRLHDVKINPISGSGFGHKGGVGGGQTAAAAAGQILEYTGRGQCLVDVGLAQARSPVCTRNHYFEIEIVNPGSNCYIAIGLARKNYPKNRHPGWNRGSIAYHADDGKLFVGSGKGAPFGPRCHKGDIMGCGVLFPRNYECKSDSDEELEQQCGGGGLEGSAAAAAGSGPAGNGGGGGGGRPGGYELDPLAGLQIALLSRLQRCNGGGGVGYDNDLVGGGGFSDGDEEDDCDWLAEDGGGGGGGDDKSYPQNGVKVEIYFTRNGEVVGRREIRIPKGGFYPTIGMMSCYEKVRVDLRPLSG